MKISVRIIIPIFFLLLLVSACRPKQQPLIEESLLGEWYTIKGDVEAYSFLKDERSYIFTGTQSMRPVVYGTWKIDKNKFIIIMDNGTTTEYSFSLMNDTLILNDGAEIYTRTAPLEVKYPEVRILKNITSDFNKLTFTQPGPSDINWGIYVDSTHGYKEFTLKGFSISTGTTLSSLSLSEISDYIKDYGFESDTSFMSEVCNGYWDADQIVTICTSQSAEAENDSVYVQISSGIINK
jgi:hypothetical protein